jgi:serine protease
MKTLDPRTSITAMYKFALALTFLAWAGCASTSQTDAAPPFSAAWDSTAVIDGSYAIAATAIDPRGTASTTRVAINVANGGCLDTLFAARGLPRAIPDASALGIASSLSVPARASVAGLALSLRVTHPFPPDLDISLISPTGTEIALGELPYQPGAAGVEIDDLPITAFDGQRATGAWTLAVRDLDPGDLGTLDAWSLSFTGACTP